jgi:hypothetical protein
LFYRAWVWRTSDPPEPRVAWRRFIGGVIFSLLGQIYIVHTFVVDPKLRKANITRLLVCAAVVEIIFCVAMISQEIFLRIPNDPCIPMHDTNNNGWLDGADCDDISHAHAWPTWEKVHNVFESEQTFRNTKFGQTSSDDDQARIQKSRDAGQRGHA